MSWQRGPRRSLQGCQRTSIGWHHGIAKENEMGGKQNKIRAQTLLTKKKVTQPSSLRHEGESIPFFTQINLFHSQQIGHASFCHRTCLAGAATAPASHSNFYEHIVRLHLVNSKAEPSWQTLPFPQVVAQQQTLKYTTKKHKLNPANVEIGTIESSERCKSTR